MIRVLLLAVLMFLVARAFWQVVDGIIAALGGGREASRTPRRQPVKLVRDPVCGTYVPPRGALSVTERDGVTYYFCSEQCRAKFRKKTA